MKIQIQHISSQGMELVYEEPAAGFASVKELMDSAECGFVTPVAIKMQVTLMPDFIRVKGRLSTTARLACVRCLEDFDQPLDSSFTLDYSKEIPSDLHGDDKAGVELTAQQIGMIHYTGDEIDFKDAIQEQIILAVPYQPLCHDGCKGLCPQCGLNLNTGGCQCGDKAPSGPFDILKDLKLPSQ
jgi:uncharacterized protein